MARANWDVTYGTIQFTYNEQFLPKDDTVHCVSNTHSLKSMSSAWTTYLYNGKIDIINSSITLWSYTSVITTNVGLFSRVITSPVTTSYFFSFATNVTNPNSYYWSLYRYNSGVATQLAGSVYFYVTQTLNNWNQFRMTTNTVGSGVILNLDWWNGAAWVNKVTYTDTAAGRLTVGGYVGWGISGVGNHWVDDIIITEFI